MPSGLDPFDLYWKQARYRALTLQRSKVCELSLVKNRVTVICPHSEEFVGHAHRLRGQWMARTLRWQFSRDQWDEVLKISKGIFGDMVKIGKVKI